MPLNHPIERIVPSLLAPLIVRPSLLGEQVLQLQWPSRRFDIAHDSRLRKMAWARSQTSTAELTTGVPVFAQDTHALIREDAARIALWSFAG